MKKIYLAGGLHSNWQDTAAEVLAQSNTCMVFDPRKLGALDLADTMHHEKLAIRASDFLFVYWEATNPTAMGLAFEMGYADAHDIPIIFVNEGHANPTAEWLASVCEFVTTDFQEGLEYMRALTAPVVQW